MSKPEEIVVGEFETQPRIVAQRDDDDVNLTDDDDGGPIERPVSLIPSEPTEQEQDGDDNDIKPKIEDIDDPVVDATTTSNLMGYKTKDGRILLANVPIGSEEFQPLAKLVRAELLAVYAYQRSIDPRRVVDSTTKTGKKWIQWAEKAAGGDQTLCSGIPPYIEQRSKRPAPPPGYGSNRTAISANNAPNTRGTPTSAWANGPKQTWSEALEDELKGTWIRSEAYASLRRDMASPESSGYFYVDSHLLALADKLSSALLRNVKQCGQLALGITTKELTTTIVQDDNLSTIFADGVTKKLRIDKIEESLQPGSYKVLQGLKRKYTQIIRRIAVDIKDLRRKRDIDPIYKNLSDGVYNERLLV